MALEHFILYIPDAKGGKCCHSGLPLYELQAPFEVV